MTLNELDLLNAEELLELAQDNVLAVDDYNFSQIVLKVAQWEHEEGWEEGFLSASSGEDKLYKLLGGQ